METDMLNALEKEVLLILKEYLIDENSGSIVEYERGKSMLRNLICKKDGYTKYDYQQAMKFLANYVGV